MESMMTRLLRKFDTILNLLTFIVMKKTNKPQFKLVAWNATDRRINYKEFRIFYPKGNISATSQKKLTLRWFLQVNPHTA